MLVIDFLSRCAHTANMADIGGLIARIKAVWTDRALSVRFPFDLCVFFLYCGRLFDLFRYRGLDWLICICLLFSLTGEGSEKERRTVKMRPFIMVRVFC
jgi:hypothetical protein